MNKFYYLNFFCLRLLYKQTLNKLISDMYYKSHIFYLILLIALTNACSNFEDYNPDLAFDAYEKQCICPSDLPYSTG